MKFNVLFVIVKSGLLQIRERREGETVQVLEMWILVNFMWGLLFFQKIFDSDELIDLNQEVIKNEKDNKPF